MAIRARQILTWAPITALATMLFCFSLVPEFGIAALVVSGAFLFVSISMLIGLPSLVRATAQRPSVWGFTLAGAESAAIVAAIVFVARTVWPVIPFQRELCESVVCSAESGRLAEQSPGILMLPSGMGSASLGGRVYVTHLPAGRLYLFKTEDFYLRAQEFSGYVYSTIPMDDLAIERYENVAFLKVNFLGSWQPGPPFEYDVPIEPTAWSHWLRIPERREWFKEGWDRKKR